MTQPDNDLALIDAALAEERVTSSEPADRELQELALALRADSPEAARFADELGERVREGFPRTGPAQGLRGLADRLPRPRRLLPVMAAAATLLIALAVAVPLLRVAATTPMTGGGRRPPSDSAQPQAESESRSGMTQPSPVPPPGGTGQDFDPGRGQRSIERSASLSLEAPGDELDRVAEGVAKVADRQRGFVLRSSVSSGEESGGGTLELRVPADRLRDTLRDLSALGKVRSRSESGQDVTASVVSASDRLESARAERASLLRRLRRPTTTPRPRPSASASTPTPSRSAACAPTCAP